MSKMFGYRPIEALPGVQGNDPGYAPETLMLKPDQLVVNLDYQRELSLNSLRMIRRIAENWDWASYKAPNVCRTGNVDVYELVDGQHTAIAAATNGNIPLLPCLLSYPETLADKAKGFIGINRNRIALTKTAYYNALVASQDDAAIMVECALSATGCRLLTVPPGAGFHWRVGDTMAIGTMLQLAKLRGQSRLADCLSIAKHAGAAPVSAAMVRALDVALPPEPPPDIVRRVTEALRGQGVGRMEIIAKGRTVAGRRMYETLADLVTDVSKLGAYRLGRPPSKKRARA